MLQYILCYSIIFVNSAFFRKRLYKSQNFVYNILKRTRKDLKLVKFHKFILITSILLLIITEYACAHPGRTDKYGGHTDSSTGLYHYHMDDGSIVYGEKPTTDDTKKTDESTKTESNSHVTEQKPLQENVKIQTTTTEIKKNNEEIKTVINNDGTKVIYITKHAQMSKVFYTVIIILSVFAVLGISVFSSVICELIRKTEKTNWYKILYIFYNLFWIPSILGNIIIKLYVKLNGNMFKKKDDPYSFDYSYEEM